MKNLYLRSSLALACALGLAACGGGNGNLTISGNVTGMPADGQLVLQNNGGSDLTIRPGVSAYHFDGIGTDSEYDISVKKDTIPVNYECAVPNGKGKTGAYSVRDVTVVCNLIPRNLSGIVKNLNNSGLIVINGATRIEIKSGAARFEMTTWALDTTTGKNVAISGQVGQTQRYGLAILQQPNGQTCTLSKGSGVVGTADVTDIEINC